jgi:protein-tyrosine-phosphatase
MVNNSTPLNVRIESSDKVLSIGVICRYNLVRSKFLESYLNENYPNIEFWSAGTNVEERTHFNFETGLLKKFGIVVEDKKSRPLAYFKENRKYADLLLVAEKSLKEAVEEIYPDTRIIFLDEIGLLLGLNLRDPIGIERTEFNLEISKYAFSASYGMNQFLAQGVGQLGYVLAIIPRRESSISTVRRMIHEELEIKNTFILHTGPAGSAYLERHKISSFALSIRNLQDFSEFILRYEGKRIFHFEHEILHPQRVMPSSVWRRNIERLTQDHRLILHTAPFFNSRNVFDPLSIFGTLPSLEVKIV